MMFAPWIPLAFLVHIAGAERDEVLMLQTQFAGADRMDHGSNDTNSKAVVFYNLFAKDADVPRVVKLARDQLSKIDPAHHELRINMIGAIKEISTLGLDSTVAQQATRRHYQEGNEDLTLHDLWSYCQDAPPSKVVIYIHSKGSFHDKAPNNHLRRYATAGALSEECRTMPDQCNTCSSRMSPIPYPQSSGNMWAARCGYVAKLMDPKKLVSAMETTPGTRRGYAWCVGRKRYTNEYWLYSHPEASPCDLDADENYVWGYRDNLLALTKAKFKKDLKPAPRFELSRFTSKYVALPSARTCQGVGETEHERLVEYKSLYGNDPPEKWWGWSFFKTPNEDPLS